MSINATTPKPGIRSRLRLLGAGLLGTAMGFAMIASALAADPITLRVGDQKGGNRSLLEIAGLAKDLPSATSKTRRSKGPLLDADKGSHSNAD